MREAFRHGVGPTVASVLIVFLVVIGALTAVDRWVFNGPDTRTAVDNSVTNGQNLCEFNRAMADAFMLSAERDPDMSPEVRAAVDHLVDVAKRCTPPEGANP